MNGYQKGAITGGIAKGINTAMAGVLNLYGMNQRMNVQQQQLDIQKQNSSSYQKMMHYNLASRFEREIGDELSKWMAHGGTRPSIGGTVPRANRLGLDATLQADPRYLQPGADALLDY